MNGYKRIKVADLDNEAKEFPEGMVPLGTSVFRFDCHPGVECFTVCCKNVDLTLYPYDIIRLKNCLGIDSEDFVRKHTFLVRGEKLFFPSVKLRLLESEGNPCPFLLEDGCSVYRDRPSACRTYPLERAVDRSCVAGPGREYYFMTDHPYCLGHREVREFTVKRWIRNQGLIEFNAMNSLWAELDTVFSANPFKGEGAGGEKQRLAFMVCYNIDGFRRFERQNNLLKSFRVSKDEKKRILREDSELQKFGFEWLKLLLTGRSSLVRK
jgi:Fe-S-cluster containining protein